MQAAAYDSKPTGGTGLAHLIDLLEAAPKNGEQPSVRGDGSETRALSELGDVSDPTVSSGERGDGTGAASWDRVVALARERDDSPVGAALLVAGLLGVGDFRDSIACAEKLERTWQVPGSAPALPLHYVRLWSGSAHRLLGELSHAERVLGDATSLAVARGDELIVQAAAVQLGQLHIANGNYRRAVRVLEPVASKPTRARSFGVASFHLMRAHRSLGEFDLAVDRGRECLAFWGRGRPEFQANRAKALNGLALVCGEKGDHTEACVMLQESIALKRAAAIPDPLGIAISLHNLANERVDLGQLQEARTSFSDAKTLLESSGKSHLVEYVRTLLDLADLEITMGDFEVALSTTDSAYSAAARFRRGENEDVVDALRLRSSALDSLGRAVEAAEALNRARSIDYRLRREE